MLDKHAAKLNDNDADLKEIKRWFFKENIRLEQQRKDLEEQRKQLERQKKDFQREQSATNSQNRMLRRQLEHEKHLFDMKWKVLEDELRRLAEDKRQIEKERREYQALRENPSPANLHYEIFFVGVNSKQALKKRYKDLIKIFHPDNLAGDKETLQEINREYDTLRQIFI